MTHNPPASDEDVQALMTRVPVAAELKVCSVCEQAKAFADYYPGSGRNSHLLRPACKPCHNGAYLQRYHNEQPFKDRAKAAARRSRLARYGLTIADYDALLADQGGACAICSVPEGDARNGTLCVDHSHATGRVRGLLCHRCNAALGHFDENTETIQKAIAFLVAGGHNRVLT